MNTRRKEKLRIEGLTKVFKNKNAELTALEDVDLVVEDGDFVSVVGTSGCGKTTLMRTVAGLETDYDGEVLLNGNAIHGPGIDRAMIFQEHRLLPWYTVAQNVGFGWRMGPKAGDRDSAVQHYLDLVGLSGFEKAYPSQISGGMAQRAAIARALVGRPDLLLLDEPLGALDALTRMYMQQELERIWRQERCTVVMVTHDIEEAVFLSNKIVIMSCRPGKVKRIVPVPLARPRDRASYDFMALKEQVLREFHLQVEHHFSYNI